MRTRTLLLLAVACGLVILVAGGVQLWRFAGESGEADADLAIGGQARAGDLDVTVVAADEVDGLMRVTMQLSGVDDPDGLDNFRLIVSGAALAPLSATQAGGNACQTMSVASQTCDLVFATATAEGAARVLIVRRGEDQHRWNLTDG